MKKIMTLLIVLASTVWPQTVVNLPASVTVTADATDCLNVWMRGQFSGTVTPSTESINAAATTMNVASTTGIANNALVLVDNEVLQVSSKTASQLTFSRGALGTVAASHGSGAGVQVLRYRSFMVLFLAILNAKVGEIMDASPAGILATQDGIIATAKAAKETAKAAAVQ